VGGLPHLPALCTTTWRFYLLLLVWISLSPPLGSIPAWVWFCSPASCLAPAWVCILLLTAWDSDFSGSILPGILAPAPPAIPVNASCTYCHLPPATTWILTTWREASPACHCHLPWVPFYLPGWSLQTPAMGVDSCAIGVGTGAFSACIGKSLSPTATFHLCYLHSAILWVLMEETSACSFWPLRCHQIPGRMPAVLTTILLPLPEFSLNFSFSCHLFWRREEEVPLPAYLPATVLLGLYTCTCLPGPACLLLLSRSLPASGPHSTFWWEV